MFYYYLSLSSKQAKSGPSIQLPLIPLPTEGTEVVHVLIVDDSIPIQKLMKRWLEHNGCRVTCASNGKVGLSLMKSIPVDIVLMDFLMVCSYLINCYCYM